VTQFGTELERILLGSTEGITRTDFQPGRTHTFEIPEIDDNFTLDLSNDGSGTLQVTHQGEGSMHTVPILKEMELIPRLKEVEGVRIFRLETGYVLPIISRDSKGMKLVGIFCYLRNA